MRTTVTSIFRSVLADSVIPFHMNCLEMCSVNACQQLMTGDIPLWILQLPASLLPG